MTKFSATTVKLTSSKRMSRDCHIGPLAQRAGERVDTMRYTWCSNESEQTEAEVERLCKYPHAPKDSKPSDDKMKDGESNGNHKQSWTSDGVSVAPDVIAMLHGEAGETLELKRALSQYPSNL
jgi:hypothetical protein